MSLLLLAMLTVNMKTGMGSSCQNFANVIICVWSIHFSMLVLPIKVNFSSPELITLLYHHHCSLLSIHVLFFIVLGNCKRLLPLAGPGWRDHRPRHCAFAHKLCYQQSAGPDFRDWSVGWEPRCLFNYFDCSCVAIDGGFICHSESPPGSLRSKCSAPSPAITIPNPQWCHKFSSQLQQTKNIKPPPRI